MPWAPSVRPWNSAKFADYANTTDTAGPIAGSPFFNQLHREQHDVRTKYIDYRLQLHDDDNTYTFARALGTP